MRMIQKRWPSHLIKLGTALALLSGIPATASAEETLQLRNAAYMDQVVGVLRSHVLSMRMILDHDDLKYADNMVRHAEAFERTFGMIGPMEWHVAEAFTMAQNTDAAEKFTQEQFEELAQTSSRAIFQIKRSANRYVRDGNKELMRSAINKMIKSCGACHSHFPKGSVPSVWKGMKE